MSKLSDGRLLTALFISLTFGGLAEARKVNLFPVAVGNQWIYRCGADAGVFEKTFRVVERSRRVGHDGWLAELTSAGQRSPSFIWRGSNDVIYRMTGRDQATIEALGPQRAAEGQRIGSRVLRRERQRSDLKRFGAIWRAEAYPLSADDGEDRRAAWSATWFAENIGIVAEGRASDGGCRLVRYLVGRRGWRS